MAIINQNYDQVFIEAQVRFLAQTPDGKDFWIEQGQQFKWAIKLDDPSSCYSCGTRNVQYLVDAYAHCDRGTLFEEGKGVYLPGQYFIETESLRHPPVSETMEYKVYRRYVRHEVPPHERTQNENQAWLSGNYNSLPRSNSSTSQDTSNAISCYPCLYNGVKGLT